MIISFSFSNKEAYLLKAQSPMDENYTLFLMIKKCMYFLTAVTKVKIWTAILLEKLIKCN